jgi:myo-inositol 2-dehydrogenase/D-chiro-inositol 1-dehydrogenase
MSGKTKTGGSRREFLTKTTVAAGAALAGQMGLAPQVYAAGSDTISVGLIGCGGRGTGAVDNVLHAAPNVRIVALADAFQDRLDGCRNRLQDIAKNDGAVKQLGNTVDIGQRAYVGLDAYERLLNDKEVNYVILATPPGFRPLHLQAAVAAGKNIFTEKPVGVDGPGIRTVLAAYEEAKKKGLAIAAGTQRRHQLGYIETIKRLHDGAIGDLVAGRCYWNMGILWHVKRTPEMSDLQYQMRNWYNFTWLCGDHIVEQHVHNIDVINWAFQAHPVRAVGMGGRQRSVPNPQDFGNIFDHFCVDFEYPNGVHVMSMCRQISGCADSVSEAVVGTKGTCQVNAYNINGQRTLTREQDRQSTDPYVQEHTDLIKSIRGGKPINELKNVAESTLSAILGRMSTYTGNAIAWDQALNSRENLMPAVLDWNMDLPPAPVAVPGRKRFW